MSFSITRKIEIDAGHRIPLHDSKCKNVHGHRYVIEATVSGSLVQEGPQEGMILDFSFLKRDMMNVIHFYCDHVTILTMKDPIFRYFIPNEQWEQYWEMVGSVIHEHGWFQDTITNFGAVYILPVVPTAENLAEHWFNRLNSHMSYERNTKNLSYNLVRVRVYETPNCWADYPS